MSRARPFALAVVAASLLSAPLGAQCPDGTPAPCGPATARPATGSVAVLEFVNESRDTTDAYLADGFTEEITARLGQIARLVVASRTAVQRLPHAAGLTPQALGRRLNVAYLVSGGVRRGVGRVRVSVELLRAATGVTVWSNLYDRRDGDLLEIEEDLATAIAGAIAGRLLPAEQAALAARPTSDPSAYDHFLRGNFYLQLRNPDATLRAIAEYQAALDRDPAFVRASARAAYAHGLFVDWGWPYPGMPRESLLATGMREADRALRQDSTLSDAWMARAYLLRLGDPETFAGAAAAFQRALALDPRNAEAAHQYGFTLLLLGRDSAARATYQTALAVDPARAITLDELSLLYVIRHRYAEALAWEDSSLAVDPNAFYAFADRGHTKLLLGDVEGARRDAEAARRLSPPSYAFWSAALFALLAARSGDTAAAQAAALGLRRAIADSRDPILQEVRWIGGALAAAGRKEDALALIESVSAKRRGAELWFMLHFPEFDALRDHPRFRRVLDAAKPPGGLEP